MFVALFIAGIYLVPRFPFGPYRLYSHLTPEQLADKISYQSLTDENTRPVWNGQTHAHFAPSISKFPHVRDCLVKSQQQEPQPDLRLIDWDQIDDGVDAAVCIWRIFTSLETDERIEQWNRFHAFKQRIKTLRYGDIYPTTGLRAFFGWNITQPLYPIYERDASGKIAKTRFENSDI